MPSPALHTLVKLRRAAREETQAALARAEAELLAQTARHQAVLDATTAGRAALDPTDPNSLSVWAAFRMRQEVAERREAAKRMQKERDVTQKRALHVARVREELALEKLIERQAADEDADLLRRESRRMDEIAGRPGSSPVHLDR